MSICRIPSLCLSLSLSLSLQLFGYLPIFAILCESLSSSISTVPPLLLLLFWIWLTRWVRFDMHVKKSTAWTHSWYYPERQRYKNPHAGSAVFWMSSDVKEDVFRSTSNCQQTRALQGVYIKQDRSATMTALAPLSWAMRTWNRRAMKSKPMQLIAINIATHIY